MFVTVKAVCLLQWKQYVCYSGSSMFVTVKAVCLLQWKQYVCYSESSMFVSKNRFILKTCGRTSLLHAVEPLLSLVQSECDMDRVDVSLQLLFLVSLSHVHNSCP